MPELIWRRDSKEWHNPMIHSAFVIQAGSVILYRVFVHQRRYVKEVWGKPKKYTTSPSRAIGISVYWPYFKGSNSWRITEVHKLLQKLGLDRALLDLNSAAIDAGWETKFFREP